MSDVLLTKRIEFAAAHRYVNAAWSAERNRAVFGACYNEPGHGHNYLLEVTIAGQVDPATGMVVNLTDLKRLLERVLEEFDHKHFNLDTPYFQDRIPTTENIVQLFWQLITRRGQVRLEKIRLFEDEDLYAELTSELSRRAGQAPWARVGRRYHFSAAHRLDERDPCAGATAHGHNYVVEVIVAGPIDRETGMVVNLGQLDTVVQERLIDRFHLTDLSHDPGFADRPPTGEHLVKLMWARLAEALPAVERIRLEESRETAFTYPGR